MMIDFGYYSIRCCYSMSLQPKLYKRSKILLRQFWGFFRMEWPEGMRKQLRLVSQAPSEYQEVRNQSWWKKKNAFEEKDSAHLCLLEKKLLRSRRLNLGIFHSFSKACRTYKMFYHELLHEEIFSAWENYLMNVVWKKKVNAVCLPTIVRGEFNGCEYCAFISEF